MTAITVKDEDANCCSVFTPKCEVVRNKTEEVKKCKVYLSKKMLCDEKNSVPKCSQMKAFSRMKVAEHNKRRPKINEKVSHAEKKGIELDINKEEFL